MTEIKFLGELSLYILQSWSSLYTENTSMRKGPRNTRDPPRAPKDVLVSFWSLARGYENMKTFNAVRCHPLYVKISQIM